MKRVLVLGGAGFIGSYVVRELLGRGDEVTVVDNFSKYGTLQHDFFAHPKCALIVKDVEALADEEFRGYDAVLCLAALIGGIRYFHERPYRIARDNTAIVARAIDGTLTASPRATFGYFSSSMVYERTQRPVTEEDVWNQPMPITNYGLQKLFGEAMVRGAREEFGLTYLIVRPFNAVGSGELPEISDEGHVEFGMAHVIPDFIYKALVRQSPFEIFGDGEQVRTFTHAKDVARAVGMLLAANVTNDGFNVCGSATCRIRDLAQTIWSTVNGELDFPGFKHLAPQPGDVRFRVGVSEKANRVFGWTPRYGLQHILEETIPFIRQHLEASRPT